MPVGPARFCSRCGAPAETREVEGRAREVCSQCETVLYRNPLPVAAAVVLNERREALLVKRRNDPYRGAWCLPMGFAELGETIGEAALRELAEETGVTGRIGRLLDSDSYESDVYGELLIVTFEVESDGAEPKAGDDAEEVRFYPFDALPPLPFRSNAMALKACAAAHADEWTIMDSFSRLDAEDEEELVSDALVARVRDHARELIHGWYAEVRTDANTASYRQLDTEALLGRATMAISQFGRWLKGREADAEVRAFYRVLGSERRSQGFGLREVLRSLTLLKKHLWMFARGQGVGERPLEVYRVLELARRIAVFFDRAMVHTAAGFEAGPV